MKTIDIKTKNDIVLKLQKRVKRLKWQRKALIWLLGLFILCAAHLGSVWLLSNILAGYFIHDVPAIHVKRAEANELKWPDIGDCEQFRPVVQKYFGKLTDEALFVAKNESGCIADRISGVNKDGSRDYCLFQITREKLAAQSLEVCVRRAWEKYKEGRIGKMNWSAFYSVCDVYAKPIHPNIISNCS